MKQYYSAVCANIISTGGRTLIWMEHTARCYIWASIYLF